MRKTTEVKHKQKETGREAWLLKKYSLCFFFDLKDKGDGVCSGLALNLGFVDDGDLFASHGVVLCQLGSDLLCNFIVVRPVLEILQQIKEELILGLDGLLPFSQIL